MKLQWIRDGVAGARTMVRVDYQLVLFALFVVSLGLLATTHTLTLVHMTNIIMNNRGGPRHVVKIVAPYRPTNYRSFKTF